MWIGIVTAREKVAKKKSHGGGLNSRPAVYETAALPLSYRGGLFLGGFFRRRFDGLGNETHLAPGNFPERGDDFLVLAANERINAFVEFASAFGRDMDQGKTIFAVLETVFDGYSCHEGVRF